MISKGAIFLTEADKCALPQVSGRRHLQAACGVGFCALQLVVDRRQTHRLEQQDGQERRVQCGSGSIAAVVMPAVRAPASDSGRMFPAVGGDTIPLCVCRSQR